MSLLISIRDDGGGDDWSGKLAGELDFEASGGLLCLDDRAASTNFANSALCSTWSLRCT